MGDPSQPKSGIPDNLLKWFSVIGVIALLCICGYLVVFQRFRLSNEQEIFGIKLVKQTATSTQISEIIPVSPTLPITTPTTNVVVNSTRQQKICGADAFVAGSYYTANPIFKRPDGYTSGWITSDPTDMRLIDGEITTLKSRAVILVDDVSEVSLENVALSDGHAQVWGCWFRNDLTPDVWTEAESEFYKMQTDSTNLPIALRIVSPNGIDTVSQIVSIQPILVRREYTGAGNLIAYGGFLPENQIISVIGAEVESLNRCSIYMIRGPMDFSFRLKDGFWEQHIISSNAQTQSIIDYYYGVLGNSGCSAEQIQIVEMP